MARGLAIGLMLAIATCGHDDGSGGPFAPIDQLDSAYQQAYCTHLVTCGEFPDQATCLTANIGGFPLTLAAPAANSDVIAAVLAGSVIYNGTTMQQCIDAFANQTCDTTDQDGRVEPLECVEALRGTVAAGGACHLDVECVSQVCNPQCQQGHDVCCAGTCVGDTPPVPQLIAIGMPCSSDTCVAGAFCDGNTATCTPLLPAGSACTDSSSCAYGLSCTFVGGGVACMPLPGPGDRCPNLEQCRDEGTTCVAGTCVAVGLPSVACTTTSACSQYFQCDLATQECVPTPRIGESCAGAMRCFDLDSYCDSDTQLCTAMVDNGQPCTSSPGCKSGQCMISETVGVCVAPTACI